jgi:metal-responsive CopG/Arc/MetJ family transcriptional regulator
MSRPKLKEESKRKSISLTINNELEDLLNKICQEKEISKSKYIEHLLKKEIEKNNNKYEG